MSETKWKEVSNPDTWKYDEAGQSIEGVLVDKQAKTEEVSARYLVETTEGIKLVWGSAALDTMMAGIKVGSQIKIEYHGKKDIGNKKTLHQFKVFEADTTQPQTPEQMPVAEPTTAPEPQLTQEQVN